MATMDEVLDLARRDPIATFVAIPIAAARPPRPRILVELKGRTLVLPDWTGSEWGWYGDLAIRYADSVDKARAGVKDVQRANRNLTALRAPMKNLGDSKPDPLHASKFYFATVKLVIAAHVASDKAASGVMFVDAFKESVKNVPTTIGEALAALLGAGGDVIKPIIREAVKITAEVFEQSIGIGIGIVLIGLAAWWVWQNSRKGES